MDVHICPFCQKDQEEELCEHFVASLCNDGDGFDVEMPLYFGWYGESASHDVMMDAVHGFLGQVLEILKATASEGPAARTAALAKFDRLPTISQRIVGEFLRELERHLAAADEPDVDAENLAAELDLEGPCRDAFEELFIASGGEKAEPYEIAHSPGLTWTGKNYWASFGGSDCAVRITEVANAMTAQVESVLKS